MTAAEQPRDSIAAAETRRYDLMMTDVVMPDMAGDSLAATIWRSRCPIDSHRPPAPLPGRAADPGLRIAGSGRPPRALATCYVPPRPESWDDSDSNVTRRRCSGALRSFDDLVPPAR